MVCRDFLQLLHRLKIVPQSFLLNTMHNHRTALPCVTHSIHLTRFWHNKEQCYAQNITADFSPKHHWIDTKFRSLMLNTAQQKTESKMLTPICAQAPCFKVHTDGVSKVPCILHRWCGYKMGSTLHALTALLKPPTKHEDGRVLEQIWTAVKTITAISTRARTAAVHQIVTHSSDLIIPVFLCTLRFCTTFHCKP